MNKFKVLKSKIMDYMNNDIDLKSPRTKKAIIILGYSAKDLVKK